MINYILVDRENKLFANQYSFILFIKNLYDNFNLINKFL
jgi:hypothetical protein